MVIDIINNKGGTGKTTTGVNLSAALARTGHSVLLVDMDSQSSATSSLGAGNGGLGCCISDVLLKGAPAANAVRGTDEPGLKIIPGDIGLASADLVLADAPARERRLERCLAPVRDEFDFILLDGPPSLSTVFVNTLVASDSYIVPLVPEYLSLQGMLNLMKAVEEINKGTGAEPSLLGILFTMINPGIKRDRKLTREIIDAVCEQYKGDVFRTRIARNIMMSEAPAHGGSIFSYAPRSVGARAYESLAEEVVRRCSERL